MSNLFYCPVLPDYDTVITLVVFQIVMIHRLTVTEGNVALAGKNLT